jgi:hypothetical protein
MQPIPEPDRVALLHTHNPVPKRIHPSAM